MNLLLVGMSVLLVYKIPEVRNGPPPNLSALGQKPIAEVNSRKARTLHPPDEDSQTVPVGIALFLGIHEIPWEKIVAASIPVTLPLIGMVFAFQKRMVQGLTAGAVKG